MAEKDDQIEGRVTFNMRQLPVTCIQHFQLVKLQDKLDQFSKLFHECLVNVQLFKNISINEKKGHCEQMRALVSKNYPATGPESL
jgi:hypothetical protein